MDSWMQRLNLLKNKQSREKAYEDETPPIYMVNVLHPHQVNQGVYLLAPKDAPMIVAPYHCHGYHHQLSEEQYAQIDDAQCRGFAGLPPDIRITMEHEAMGCHEDITLWKQQLYKLKEPSLQLLSMQKHCHHRELTKKGKRIGRRISLFIALELNPTGNHHHAFTDKLLAGAQRLYYRFNDQETIIEQQRLEQLFAYAIERLGDVEGKLQHMRLPLIPWDIHRIYQRCMDETCDHFPKEISHRVNYDVTHRTLSETATQDLDIRSQRLHENVPLALPDAIKIKHKWVGAVVLEEKPYGFDTATQTMQWLWNVIKDIPDIKIVTQITGSKTNLYLSSNLEWTERLSRNEMFTGNVTNTQAEIDAEDAVEIRREMTAGAKPFEFALVILVYRDSREALALACRTLRQQIQLPGLLTRETCYAARMYQQCQPYSVQGLLTVPFHRCLFELSSNLSSFLPLTLPHSVDREGFEFIAEGNTPIYVNCNKPSHKAVFSITRGGKSVLISGMLQHALEMDLQVMIMDFPGPDGTSTFTQFTKQLGGAYLDIRSETFNLFELPDASYLEALKTKTSSDRFNDFQDDLFQVLSGLVIGTEQISPERKQAIETLVGLGIQLFFQQANIIQRYCQAYEAGTEETMPTFNDFIDYLVPESFRKQDIDLSHLGYIKSRLKFLAQGPCRSLAGISSVDSNQGRILAYALTNLTNDEDAYIFGMMFYLLIIRRAAAHPRQIVFIDEASVLFKYDSLAKLFGKLSSNGAKFGISLWIAAQDAETIYHSAAGEQIFANLSTILVGKIKPSAVDTLQKILHCDRSLLLKNTGKSFGQNPQALSSDWLLDDANGNISHCRAYIAPLLLAMVANNPAERIARDALLEHYDDPLEGLVDFSHLLRYCLATAIAVDELTHTLIAEAQVISLAVPKHIQQWRNGSKH